MTTGDAVHRALLTLPPAEADALRLTSCDGLTPTSPSGCGDVDLIVDGSHKPALRLGEFGSTLMDVLGLPADYGLN